MPINIEYIDQSIIPKEGTGYLFIDLDNPIVCWESSIGAFLSTGVDNEIDKIIRPSLWMANIIHSGNNIKLLNEIIIENVRRKHFPHKISRIEGMFFLKDLDSAKECLDWGGHFSIINLSEIYYFTKHEVTKCDSNWITHINRDNNGIVDYSYYDSLMKYWAGEVYPFCEFPAWEYIINGILNIMSPRIKTQSFINSTTQFPQSKDLLSYSIMAPHIGINFGHIVPYIIREANDKLKLTYIIKFNMEDIDKIKTVDPEILKNLNIKLNPNPSIVLPDLRSYNLEFSISNNYSNIWDQEFIKIHI